MVIKRTISGITKGADLLKPKPNLEYVVAAVVGVGVLMLVYKGGQILFDRFSAMGQSYNPYAPKPDYAAALGII
jgi:hypothetical protein